MRAGVTWKASEALREHGLLSQAVGSLWGQEDGKMLTELRELVLRKSIVVFLLNVKSWI